MNMYEWTMRKLPEHYYDTMWADGFSAAEIFAVGSRDLYNEAMERKAFSKPELPTNIQFQVEVLQK